MQKNRFAVVFSIGLGSFALVGGFLLLLEFFFVGSGKGVELAFAQTDDVITQTVQLFTVRDNTLYHSVSGIRSNGSGDHFFVGRTGAAGLRRGVIAFDVAGSLPAGATIMSATLSLNMSRTADEETAVSISIHSLQKDWGESSSHAAGHEGKGAQSEPGDATWLHTFYDAQLWEQPGGDFDAIPLAATMVSNLGRYEWQSNALTEDVRAWHNNSEANFGWLLLGDEVNDTSGKRFDTRENNNEANRPLLTITYTLPQATTELYLPLVRN